jgi:hypothetical protein
MASNMWPHPHLASPIKGEEHTGARGWIEPPAPFVILGLDSRKLYFAPAPQVQSPRFKPEGDNREWEGF